MTEEIKASTDEAERTKDEEAAPSLPADVPGETTPPNNSIAGSADVPATDELPTLRPILDRLEQLEQMVAQLASEIGRLVERADLLPRQVRQLGTKVDDITESVSQPRIRDLLGSLLLLYDLVDQMSLGAEAAGAYNYRVLRDQIAQALRVNGIDPIAEAQRFDPEIHKAVETIACQNPDEDGEIARVYRTGFRTERSILRYAEVVVRRYQSADRTMEAHP